MQYHPVVEKIKTLLDENHIQFDVFEHEPVRTSEEASKVRTGYVISQGAKAMIVKVRESGKGKRFVMFVVPGNNKFDPVKVKNNLGLSDIRFATETEVSEITGGVLPGGIPPFGNLFGLEVFMDKGVLENERIIFNAGDKSYSIGMLSADYLKLVNPKVEDMAVPKTLDL